MKFEQLLDKVYDVMKKENPAFKGFSEETAKAMCAAWNVMAVVLSSENTLDDLAFLAPNTNEIISIPLPSDLVEESATEDEEDDESTGEQGTDGVSDGQEQSEETKEKRGKKSKKSDGSI